MMPVPVNVKSLLLSVLHLQLSDVIEIIFIHSQTAAIIMTESRKWNMLCRVHSNLTHPSPVMHTVFLTTNTLQLPSVLSALQIELGNLVVCCLPHCSVSAGPHAPTCHIKGCLYIFISKWLVIIFCDVAFSLNNVVVKNTFHVDVKYLKYLPVT